MQTYQEAIHYLYQQLPVYHLIGPKAYKADLNNIKALCERLGNPQTKFKSVHVAGTNGKGSCSHMLAAILQSSGYKTGLYTSPHLKDFSERIRVNGQTIEPNFVMRFVANMKDPMLEINPSFFELTVAMAFEYFVQHAVDIAIIEVGLGGRLDATNVIMPELSLITNIGWDHMDILGDTLPKIASEKAGIIKRAVPVIISERQEAVSDVFLEVAKKQQAPIAFGQDHYQCTWNPNGILSVKSPTFYARLQPELRGLYQASNIAGVVASVMQLRELGWNIQEQAIVEGINKTVALTGLKGRWQVLNQSPLTIADTGHNVDGIRQIIQQIEQTPHQRLHWVFGMVKDKAPHKVLSILPKHAQYYFCQAKINRAMDASQLHELAKQYGLEGHVIPDVNNALKVATEVSRAHDLIMIGGSTFVVGEVDNL
jgi:dihydrofolate synthase / folylpolyglutamate synthase